MEDVLKRLLDTESHAEAIIEAAEAERKAMVEAALAEARAAELRSQEAAAELRQPLLREAEERADQVVAELTHKYQVRQRALRDLAERNEAAAVQAALAMLLDPDA